MNPDDIYELLEEAKKEEKLAYSSFKQKFQSVDEQMEFLFCEWLRTNRLINLMLTHKTIDEV